MSSFEITLNNDQIEVLRRAAAAHHTDLERDDNHHAGFRSVKALSPDGYMVFGWTALINQGLLEWGSGYAPESSLRITEYGLTTLKKIDKARQK